MRYLQCLCVAAVLVILALTACSATSSQGPTTWLDRPLDGDQLPFGLVTILAHASDANGVSKFEFFINETLLSSPAGSGTRFSNATVEWVPPVPGSYVVRARAIGGDGNPGREARAIIIIGSATPVPPPSQTPPPLVVEPEPLPVEGTTITPIPDSGCAGLPVISSFTADPTTVTAGGTSTLTWGPITNADSALIDHGIGGANLNGGAFPISPVTTTTYVLSATGCGGTVVLSATVTVLPAAALITVTPAPVCPGAPVIASFTANPTTITAGQTTTLSWGAVTNATSASIEPGIGGVGTPGSTQVSPAGTTTYTLTAIGCGGTTRRQVTVVVNPAPRPPSTQTPPPPPVIATILPIYPMIDKTPPSISGVSANPTMVDRNGCGSKTKSVVTARVIDAGGVNRVVARLGGVGAGDIGMGAIGGDTFRGEIGPFGASGQVSIQIVAWDKAGNSAQAGGPTVNVICIQ